MIETIVRIHNAASEQIFRDNRHEIDIDDRFDLLLSKEERTKEAFQLGMTLIQRN